ncbi:MAG: hypothetical protein FD135_4885 [Comamonadaceae bacterium]|nr:MAG: hypothetical protein FD135_4885 [Comamonadaceae bacterium]
MEVEGRQNIVSRSFLHQQGAFGQAFQGHGKNGWPLCHCRAELQGSHGAAADVGEPIKRFDFMPVPIQVAFQRPIHEQEAPAVGQRVIEDPVQPFKEWAQWLEGPWFEVKRGEWRKGVAGLDPLRVVLKPDCAALVGVFGQATHGAPIHDDIKKLGVFGLGAHPRPRMRRFWVIWSIDTTARGANSAPKSSMQPSAAESFNREANAISPVCSKRFNEACDTPDRSARLRCDKLCASRMALARLATAVAMFDGLIRDNI